MVRKLNYDDFSGATRPFRADVELDDLEVEGKIPPELDGTFYRVRIYSLRIPPLTHRQNFFAIS